MLLAMTVTAVVLGVTAVFGVAGYLIDLSVRHFEQSHGKKELLNRHAGVFLGGSNKRG